MSSELSGKVAVVTGAAAGIGLACTEAMLAAGARVVVVDHDEQALTALCDKHDDVVMFMLTRPRHVSIRDVVIMPTNFDL